MAKINIIFNNTNYSIDEASLSSATAALKAHLSNVMSGSGAIINLDGVSYNVDSAKLSAATNDFVAHLGKISGTGSKVIVNGTEYSVGSDKVAGATSELEIVLGNLHGGGSGEVAAAGLYQTGAIALCNEQGAAAIEGMMIKSWDELMAEGAIHVEDGAVHTNMDTASWTNSSSDILIGDLILPSDGSITALGEEAFYLCKNLTSITIPDSVTSIGASAFRSCGLTNITIPDSVTSIGAYAFASCGLTNITIPDSVTSIGDEAFSWCGSLTNVTIDTSIGYGMFRNCKALTSVTFGNGVTSISGYAFGNCTGLNSLTFAGTTTQWVAIKKTNYWNNKVPAKSVQCSDGQIEP